MSKVHSVYFLQRHDGLIKIGTTTDLQQRVAAITKSHGMLTVIRVINGDAKVERKLHHKFSSLHSFGEWFRGTPELIAAIAELPDGDAAPVAPRREAWAAAEARLMADALQSATRLVQTRTVRKQISKGAALIELNRDYPFSGWFLSHLVKGKATTISAHGYSVLKTALRAELAAHIEDLQRDLAAAEEDERKSHDTSR